METWLHDLRIEIRQGIERLYGKHLHGAYLFGSYARGEADKESDVDLLIVLDKLGDYCAEIDRTSHLIASLSLRFDVSISRVFVSVEDWRHRQSPFLLNVREDAVAA
jgi:predicted nucleotidyltransferase